MRKNLLFILFALLTYLEMAAEYSDFFSFSFVNRDEKTARITGFLGNTPYVVDGVFNVPSQIVYGNAATAEILTVVEISFTEKPTDIVEVRVPDTFTYINSGAFQSWSSLEKVVLPSTITSIGYAAFNNCKSLKEINLPEGVTSISQAAFGGCSSLKEISIPKGVEKIENQTFYKCSSLEKIDIPESVTAIGNYAFSDTPFKSFVIPASVSSLGERVFDECSQLKSVTIKGMVGDLTGTFHYQTSLEAVTFENPDGATSLGEDTFNGCTSLKTVKLPKSLTEIGLRAFQGCTSLETITLPDNLTTIGIRAFSECSALKLDKFPSSLNIIGDYAFEKCSSLTEVNCPASLTEISDYAFIECPLITTLNMPADGNLEKIGNWSFSGCPITSLTFPSNLQLIGREAFRWAKISEVRIPASVTWIGSGSFGNCQNLTTFVTESGNEEPLFLHIDTFLETSIKTLEWYRENTTSIESFPNAENIKIGDKVQTLGDRFFEGNLHIKSFTFPASLTTVGANAFYGCDNITELKFEVSDSPIEFKDYFINDSYKEWIRENAEKPTFPNLTKLYLGRKVMNVDLTKVSDVTIGSTMKSIPDGFLENFSNITTVTLPEKPESIGASAFAGCSGLTEIKIPETVTTIGDRAFYNCSGLTEIKIPEAVTTIGDQAFYNCSGITEIVIPAAVMTIGRHAFDHCTSLNTMTINSTPEMLTFHEGTTLRIPTVYIMRPFTGVNFTGVSVLDLGGSITSIGANAFSGNTNIKSITIPSSVTTIEENAFPSSLEHIRFEDSAEPLTVKGNLFGYQQPTLDELYIGRTIVSSEANFKNAKTCVFGDQVTAIPDNFLADNKSLAGIVIPGNITTVGERAFYNNTSLKNLTLLEGEPISFGKDAWTGVSLTDLNIQRDFVNGPTEQTEITTLTISGTCTAIPSDLLGYNKSLSEITIPASVLSIGEGAFSHCSGLKMVTIEESDAQIVANRILPPSVEHLSANREWSNRLFSNPPSELISVELGDKVTSIPSNSFSGATKLSAINLDNIKVIGNYAFEKSGLTRLEIPAIMEDISYGAFWYCPNLTSVIIKDSEESLSISNDAFSGSPVATLHMGRNFDNYSTTDEVFPSLTELTIGENVTEIPKSAFTKANLAFLTIPASVETLGKGAFSDSKINTLTIADSDQELDLTNTGLNKGVTELYMGRNWKGDSFSNITSLTLGAKVTAIPDAAFKDNYRLSNVVLNESLESIGAEAFYTSSSVSELLSFSLPQTLTSIGNDAFYGRKILSINIPKGVPSFNDNKVTITDLTVEDSSEPIRISGVTCSNLYIGRNFGTATFPNLQTLVIGEKVTAIPDGAFQNGSFVAVTLPAGLTSLGAGAFQGCSNLVTLGLQGQFTSIPDNCFESCPLPTIEIPSTVTTIGKRAFYGNRATSLTIPANVTSISAEGLSGWGLSELSISDSDTPITFAVDAFPAIPSLYIGRDWTVTNTTEKSKTPFGKVSWLTFGENVTSIPEYAFYEAPLESVEFASGIATIGKYAFDKCTNLKNLTIPSTVASFDVSSLPESVKTLRIEDGENPLQISGNSILNYFGERVTDLYMGRDWTTLLFPAVERVEFGPSVTKINDNSFKGAPLSEPIFHEGLQTIGESAFASCRNLAGVKLPQTLISIGKSAFYATYNYVDVVIPSNVENIGTNAFGLSGFDSRKSITIADGNNPINVDGGIRSYESIYIGRNWKGSIKSSYASSIKSVTIGNLVTEIPAKAFDWCSDLEELILGSAVQTIGKRAFAGNKLTSVVIPSSVTSIGEEAFITAEEITRTVDIGCGLTVISDATLFTSANLETVRITAVNPPYVRGGGSFTCPLYVPQESFDKELYKNDQWWSRFKNQYSLVKPEKIVISETANGTRSDDSDSEQKLYLSAEIFPEDTTIKHILWSSSNPEIATVDPNGVVTIVSGSVGEAEIKAFSLYGDMGPVASVMVTSEGNVTAVESITEDRNDTLDSNGNNRPNDVYTLQGILIKRNASADEVKALTPGIYIIGGKKVVVR